MRSRLIVVAVSVTSMVAIAFLVPLAILTRDLAADRERLAAENDAETIARMLIALPREDITSMVAARGTATSITDREVSIIFPDGTVAGAPLDGGENLSPAFDGASYRQEVSGGEAVYVPIIASEGTAVVRVVADGEAMTEGVARTWAILGALGVVLVLIAVFIADRMARSFVKPMEDLSAAATRLGAGDLDARVEPAGPPEIEEVGETFNSLALEVTRLIQSEREDAADLAHRLRTPLTGARLTAESLPEGKERELMLVELDELERSIDFVIAEARRPIRQATEASADVASIAAQRAAFWAPLASDEGRTFTTSITSGPALVAAPTSDLEAALDAIIGNVFAHTPPGTPFEMVVTSTDAQVVVLVSDDGPGLPSNIDASIRGTSGGTSTGLGLDIAQRMTESTGGSFRLFTAPSGGAAISLAMPVAGKATALQRDRDSA